MHAANKKFSLVITISEIFLKDLFSEFEDIGN